MPSPFFPYIYIIMITNYKAINANFNEIYDIKDYKLKSKVYIPTYKHRPNTIIDLVRDWDNVVLLTDQEDYDENYQDFPREKVHIVDKKDRSQYNKRRICAELAKQNNEWYFVIDDDIKDKVKFYDHLSEKEKTKTKMVDLYSALCIWEKFAQANNLPVTGPALSITTGTFNNDSNMLSKPYSTLNGCFFIDSSRTEPEWWTLDRSIAEDSYFTYNCLLNGIDTRRIQFFSAVFRNLGLKKSLTLTDQYIKDKFIVDTFFACKGKYCIKYNDKEGYILTLYDGEDHTHQYKEWLKIKEENPGTYATIIKNKFVPVQTEIESFFE